MRGRYRFNRGVTALQKHIEAARAYAGISSQGKLAEAIDMAPATFQRRLRGEYPWRRADLLAIAEVCEVPVEFLEHGFAVVAEEAHRTSFISRDAAAAEVDLGLDLAEDRDAGGGGREHG